MAEIIYVPADGRDIIKLFFKPLVTSHHVIYKIIVLRGGLVMSRPPSVNNLKLLLLNEFFNQILDIAVLLIVPHRKEPHFNVSELSSFIFGQFMNNSIKRVFHSRVVFVLVRTIEILVHGFDPAHIIMRVGHEMHCELLVLILSLDQLDFRYRASIFENLFLSLLLLLLHPPFLLIFVPKVCDVNLTSFDPNHTILANPLICRDLQLCM